MAAPSGGRKALSDEHDADHQQHDSQQPGQGHQTGSRVDEDDGAAGHEQQTRGNPPAAITTGSGVDRVENADDAADNPRCADEQTQHHRGLQRRPQTQSPTSAARAYEIIITVEAHRRPGAAALLPAVGRWGAERQGLGSGSALLMPVLQRCDREGIPVYTEATSLRNRRLYERHGFSFRRRAGSGLLGDVVGRLSCPG